MNIKPSQFATANHRCAAQWHEWVRQSVIEYAKAKRMRIVRLFFYPLLSFRCCLARFWSIVGKGLSAKIRDPKATIFVFLYYHSVDKEEVFEITTPHTFQPPGMSAWLKVNPIRSMIHSIDITTSILTISSSIIPAPLSSRPLIARPVL